MGRVAVAVVVGLWAVPFSFMVNRIVPEPYMVCNLSLSLSLSHSFVPAGRGVSRATSPRVLQIQFQDLGSHDHESSWPLGGIAITIRQTNMIWMLFVACLGAIDYVGFLKGNGPAPSIGSTTSVNKNEELTNVMNASASSNLRKRMKGNVTYAAEGSSLMHWNSSQASGSGLLDEVCTIICRLWYLKLQILISFLPYLVVLLIFVAFVLWNGGFFLVQRMLM